MNVRIIDLLSLESRGMKVPTKIMVFGHTFIYTGDKRPPKMYKMENQDNYLLRDFVYTLNTEVEILEEEEKKIPEKILYQFSLDYIDCNINETARKGINEAINHTNDKINEIIDYLHSKGE